MTDGPSGEMPFLDHLEELRSRLLWAVGALGVAMLLAFAVIMRPSLDVVGYLAAPVLPYLTDGKLVYTHPVDPVTIRLKIAFAVGLVLSAPVILYQIWAFLSPALHKHEKRMIVPMLLGATLLFATGVAIGWKIVLPIMLDILFQFVSASMQQMITATDYFSFMVTICLAFGGVMQLPVVVMALTALGLLTPATMAKFRRHAAAGSVVVSALITPGDLIVMTVLMALPLYALYELSMIVSWLTHRARLRRQRREALGNAALVALFAAGTLLAAPSLGAQARPPRPQPANPVPAQPGTPRGTAPGDQSRLTRITADDTLSRARRGSSARPQLVDWAPDDSVMRALLERRGYTVVRFQAGTVGFSAVGRTMTLSGTDSARAAVQRDSTLLVARDISYSDSLQLISARGDTIVMRDPAQASDVLGLRELSYDVARREGRTRDFQTVANSGNDWRVMAHRAAFTSDSTADQNTVYGRDGLITSCLDAEPHYHFLAKELKRVSNRVIVARPAILYVQDVPVMWLPFIFQDIREGRRSGILPPRIGAAELVRNSPDYRRTVENIGYYFALTDYVDAQVSMDWRSAARATEQDPGWMRFNGEVRYRWLDRFMSGTFAASQSSLSSGSRNLALSWSHAQEFSSRTRINSNLNYVSSTQVQRQTIINPLAAVATIASQLNLVRQQGPFTVNLGGSQRQYPGRDQVDRTFPSLSVASKPLELGEWFVMNPSLQLNTQQSLDLDATGDFAYRYRDVGGVIDSVRLKRDQSSTSVTFNTPFKIFDFQVTNGYRFNNVIRDYPQIITVRDAADTSARIDRIYAGTYESSFDFDVSVGLPQFFQGTWNLSPSVTASNVDSRGFAIRTHLSNGDWVMQSKRLSYGLNVAPTLYKLFPGFGRVTTFRHAITPTLGYSYSPAARVSDEFLAATNQVAAGYLGTLAQNRLSLGFSTNLEAKLRPRGDSSDAEGEKIRVATFTFTALSWDFERQRVTGKSGFATDRFGYTFRSDLLPGFDLGVDYSLFQGNILSDTAEFDPFREAVRASFTLGADSWIVRSVGRLFGASSGAPSGRDGRQAAQDATGGLVSSMGPQQGLGAITGTRSRGAVQEIPTGQGFTAAFNVSMQRQRPPVGGRVRDFDPTVECRAYPVNSFQYELCVDAAERDAANRNLNDQGAAGGTIFRVPPSTSVGFRTSFNLTPKWAASWSTMYDVERSEFASQIVTLQRELHDWKAIFGFTQAPNGNFAFTFFISLTAQPEIKLDYDRATYRPPTTARQP